jgi:zinc/manganese transport system ATP-binding protein
MATDAMAAPCRPGAIRLRELTVAYRDRPAVQDLSGVFAPGSLTAIVGPNGAGKSSLLAAIAGRVPLAGGSVEFDAAPDRRVACLPQQAEIDRGFPIRVFDLVAIGHWHRVGAFGGLDAARRRAVVDTLAMVGLAGFERRGIAELSAGQFQRVLFARLLLQDAPVILLDEPFNAIDARTTADLLALIGRWHGQGRTIVAVLHDIEQVRTHFERTLLLARRGIAWGPTAEVLRADHLLRARRSAESWDDPAPARMEASA